MRVGNLNHPFPKRVSTLLIVLGLNACISDKDDPEPACDSGVEVDGECLPSGCGPVSGATVSADPDDDLQALIDAAAPGDVIELLPGDSYPGGIEITTGPLTLSGWCPELVTIGTDEYLLPTLSVSGSEDVTITGLTVEGGAPGIYLVGSEGQTIAMERIVVQNAGSYGLDASGNFELTADDLTVSDTIVAGDGRFGRGLNLVGGVDAVIANAVLERNHEAAILVSNSTLQLTAAKILSTAVRGDDTFGRGIQLQQGAVATLSDLLVDGNNDAGICVLDSSMDLMDSIISNTSLTAISDSVTEAEAGEGVAIYLGEDGDATTRTITLSGLTIEGNARAGLLVDGLEVEVDGVTLNGNGYGAVTQSGGVITGTSEDSDPAASEVLEIYDAPMD